MHIDELLAQHQVAVRTSVAIVARVKRRDLQRPTPCAEWTLADLLAHMVAQHRGFAAAARGHGGNPSAWQVTPLGPDPVAEYVAAAGDVLVAFAGVDVPGREFHLPEFHPETRFSAERAIGFHLIDYVVHGWDVARSLGLDYGLHPRLADAALRIAVAVPNGDNRLATGSAFRPALPASDSTNQLHQVLLALGRSPDWPRC